MAALANGRAPEPCLSKTLYALQKMKETLKELAEVSLVGGPECAGAWRDRYTFEERSRLPLPGELAEARFLHDLQIQRFWELFYDQRALR